MRIAGIDFGTVRIGIAIADLAVGIASPLQTYRRRDDDADAAYFRRLVETENLQQFVVGLPVHLDGRESEKSREARAFADWLHETTRLPVDFFDERFTSVEAEQMLDAAGMTGKRRKETIDKIAAQIMLTAYLEAKGRGSDNPGGIE